MTFPYITRPPASQSGAKNQRVWVISELYYPELTSTGYFLTGIAEGLAEFYDVFVLCGQPSYWSRGVRAPSRESLNGVDVQRCWATTLDKNRALFRILNMITISLSIFILALCRFRRGDIVVAVTNPPLMPYLASLACRVRGSRFILLVHDVYPEILIRLGILKPRSFSACLLNVASRWLYESANHVLVLGRDMRDIVVQRLPSRRDRVVIATNWASIETISPKQRSENNLLASLNLNGSFVVQFWGNMGRPHCMEDLIDAAELLEDDPEIHFLLIGWGSKKGWLIAEKQARGLDNLTILEPPPRGDSCEVQNACDIAINALTNSMTGISVPSRSYNAMAAGKPTLAVCHSDSELAAMVREEHIGWVVPPGHPDLIASTIREAKANPSCLRMMSERARRSVETKYTRDHVLKVYRDIVQKARFE